MEKNGSAAMARPGKHLAWRVGIISVLGLLAVAAYAMFVVLPGSIRVAPVTVTVNSSGTLPAEAKALEAQTAPYLFDRDTTTAHIAYADQSVDAQLERSTEIGSIKVYGPAPLSSPSRRSRATPGTPSPASASSSSPTSPTAGTASRPRRPSPPAHCVSC